MRILYGITGEGLGHTMRARVVLPHLVAQGHSVLVAASARASALFRELGFDVLPIDGLAVAYRDGAAQRVETLLLNARRALPALTNNTARALGPVLDFAPDVVPLRFRFVLLRDGARAGPAGDFVRSPSCPHALSSSACRHETVVVRPRPHAHAGEAQAAALRSVPRHVVLFPRAPARGDPPRPSSARWCARPSENATPSSGEHVLVYQTASGDQRLLDTLRATSEVPFRVYGLGARPTAANVEYRAFDETSFVADLASARAVITNGGFMTLSEALVLGKPVLSCPIRHQGEQELNAGVARAPRPRTSLPSRHAAPGPPAHCIHPAHAPSFPPPRDVLATIDRTLGELV